MIVHAVRANATGSFGARLSCASRDLILILALVFTPAFAAAQAPSDVFKANPRLASLQIEIWPEFDRKATALVILKGEIAANVPLPAAVNLRIAARSGGPTAVASSATLGGSLANMNYERKDAGEFITLTFNAPERIFHIEYYDPLSITTPKRNYTYAWTGDLATDQLRLVVQEPAAASDVSVQPALSGTAAGQDGLRYRSGELGPSAAGKRQEISLRYTKSDSRTSNEILKPQASVPSASVSSPPQAAETGVGPSKLELAAWLVGIVAALGIGLGVWAGVMWWYGRKEAPEPKSQGSRFCRKCGAPTASGDRFCSKCGAKLT